MVTAMIPYDIEPDTEVEAYFTAVCMFLGLLLNAFVIGSVSGAPHCEAPFCAPLRPSAPLCAPLRPSLPLCTPPRSSSLLSAPPHSSLSAPPRPACPPS